MKFSLATPFVLAVVLAVASAHPLAERAVSASSSESQAAALLSNYAMKFQAQDAKLKQLNVASVTEAQMEPITQDVVDLVDQLGGKLNDLVKQIEAQAGNAKRQALLQPAVAQLTVDLNRVLVDVDPLLRHLTHNLELGTVQDLVDGLTPALVTLIGGLEALLNTLAPGLATLVDPLLHTVYGLTDALGLPLNLPSA